MKNIISVVIASCLTFSSTFSMAEVVWNPMPPEAFKFGEMYPEAQKLLYAFDYGHALVYERLILNRGKIKDPQAFEAELLKDILKILKNPPNIKVDEADIAPAYVYKFPKVVSLFDWSHMLHQLVLDVLATSPDRGPKMVNRVNEIYGQYVALPRLAITDVCKTMMFMDGHYFSKSFRNDYPSFNLLIWSYHWFQIRLYEALLKPTLRERNLAVDATVKEFWKLISHLPDSAEFDMMPETAAEAPTFAHLFPKLPAAFDNNHMLHDIVSDILVSPKVQESDLRSEGMRMAAMALDPEPFRASFCGHQH
jgi:hypothetical protein